MNLPNLTRDSFGRFASARRLTKVERIGQKLTINGSIYLVAQVQCRKYQLIGIDGNRWTDEVFESFEGLNAYLYRLNREESSYKVAVTK